MKLVPDLKMDPGLTATANGDDVVELLRHSAYPDADPEAITRVVAYCRAVGLDPLHKPVHLVPLWDPSEQQTRHLILPGIGLYRMVAARAGCAGIDEPEFGPDVQEQLPDGPITYPAWCRITVHRRLPSGEIVHFTAREFWQENVARDPDAIHPNTPNAMWRRRPFGQLAKCAEAQALRKGFPEIGAVPSAEEMEGKLTERPRRGQADQTGDNHRLLVGMPRARDDVQPPPPSGAGGASPAKAPNGNAPSPSPSNNHHTTRASNNAPPPDDSIATERRQKKGARRASRASQSVAPVAVTGPEAGSPLPLRANGASPCQEGGASATADLQAQPTSNPFSASEPAQPPGPGDLAASPGTPAPDAGETWTQLPVSTAAVGTSEPAVPGPNDQDPLASCGERAYALLRIELAGMSVEAAWAAAQLPTPVALDALTRSGFQALLRSCA
jgi:phage recombination protein Bet